MAANRQIGKPIYNILSEYTQHFISTGNPEAAVKIVLRLTLQLTVAKLTLSNRFVSK